jgi:pilus assembly protein CpaB
MAASAPVRRPAGAKQASRKTLFWIGIGMSVLAFLMVIVLGTVVAGRATLGTAKVGVVVATQDINRRAVITAADLTITPLPVTAVPPGAVLVASQATGKVAQVSVLKGQPLTTNLIAAEGTGDPAYLPIPQGWVAYTIAAGELRGVGGYVAPGDVIDIEATVTPDPTVGINLAGPVTRVIFPAVHVIRVGPGSDSARNGQALGVATSITVLMTTCDAPFLTWLDGKAALTYTLRSARDFGSAPAGASTSCPLGTAPRRVDWTATDKQFGFSKG